jgi:single-strand DNA-binding protein
VNDTYVTVTGNLVTDVSLRVTATGTTVASFRMATTSRRLDRDSNTWRDGHTSYYSVTCWRGLAENVDASLKKGQPVIVTGRQRVRPWTGEDGRQGVSVELDAVAVGHDLSRGTTRYEKVRRGRARGPEAEASEAALAELAAEPDAEVDPWTGEVREPAEPVTEEEPAA